MRIIILGANGQIGRAVYAALDLQFPGSEILACTRRAHLHFEGCTGDRHHRSIVFDPFYDDWASLGKADVLINCIGAIEEKTGASFVRVHEQLTAQLLHYRAAMGKPMIIQLSALGAGTENPSAFLRTKGKADALLLREANTYVIRPSIVCTPGTMIIRQLLRLRRMARLFAGNLFVPEKILKARIQPVDVRDLAQLVVRIISDRPQNNLFELAGPKIYSVEELLRLAVPGVHIRHSSMKNFERLLRAGGFLLRRWLTREQALLLQQDNVSDARAAEQLLGRERKDTRPFFEKAFTEKPPAAKWLYTGAANYAAD